MNETKHTATPWRVGTKHPGRVITDASFVASCTRFSDEEAKPDDTERANAAIIVRAVNNHVALADALESAIWGMQGHIEKSVALDIARAALAAARE